MFSSQKRFVAVVFASLALLGALLTPLGASAQGNSGAAHLCQKGGYINYTDANGNAFKNEGQCTRYAAQGGTLVQLAISHEFRGVEGDTSYCYPDITISGLTVGATYTLKSQPTSANFLLYEKTFTASDTSFADTYPESVPAGDSITTSVFDGAGNLLKSATAISSCSGEE